MSTRNSTPVGLSLVVVIGGAIGAGVIASELLGYLSTTAAGPEQAGWCVPLLSVGMPLLVLVCVALWVWSQL
jgi:hypothetical protein